jgi:hypothetical protein
MKIGWRKSKKILSSFKLSRKVAAALGARLQISIVQEPNLILLAPAYPQRYNRSMNEERQERKKHHSLNIHREGILL